LDKPSDSDFRVSSPLDSYVVHEEIRGPIFGYWLACYAIERRRGFYAYGKLCPDRPASVWDAPTALAKVSLGPRPTAEEALDALCGAVEARLLRHAEHQRAQPSTPAD
jgi:hypothetical protein